VPKRTALQRAENYIVKLKAKSLAALGILTPKTDFSSLVAIMKAFKDAILRVQVIQTMPIMVLEFHPFSSFNPRRCAR
jgi:hypothetical protein